MKIKTLDDFCEKNSVFSILVLVQVDQKQVIFLQIILRELYSTDLIYPKEARVNQKWGWSSNEEGPICANRLLKLSSRHDVLGNKPAGQ
jgi:hypothetical protein